MHSKWYTDDIIIISLPVYLFHDGQWEWLISSDIATEDGM